MTVTLKKWGNSLAARIPKSVAAQIDVQDGQQLELNVRGESIVLRPLRKEYKLSDLLKGVTKKNRHKETDWGPSKGQEV
jgi:antitoxin MazE